MDGTVPFFIIVGIIGLVIGFLIYYYRDYLPINKKKGKSTTDAEIEELLDKVRQLARAHDYQKASLLIWQTFNVAAEGYLFIRREPNQTARQFGLSLMAYDGITQETVEPLYTLFETSRYSRDQVTLQQFNAGLTGLHRFLQIANQINNQLTRSTNKGQPDTELAPETPETAS